MYMRGGLYTSGSLYIYRKDIYANSFGTLVVLYLITQLKK